MAKNAHTMDVHELLRDLKTSKEKGLTEEEARERSEQMGRNELPHKEGQSFFIILLAQCKDVMILILLIAALLSAFMGHGEDALTILAILVLNGLLGLVQEYRAERSLAMLRRISSPRSVVVRDGLRCTVEMGDLVPGDIVILKAGDRVGADARLLEVQGLEVEESMLTGEANPVEKSIETLARDLPLGDRKNMAYSGTLITRGQGRALVVQTGEETEIGHIASLLRTSRRGLTPLQKRLKNLGLCLVILCIFCCLLVVILGIYQGQPWPAMLLAGISLAVAAIPEGLPAVVTLSLALGVQRMIKRNAIIRKLPAVETLGCASVICSDKTGTITQNTMEVEVVYYKGRFWQKDTFHAPTLQSLWQLTAICNEASIYGSKGEERYIGDPTDVALLRVAWERGMNREEYLQSFSQIHLQPFSSEHKMMWVKGYRNTQGYLWAKGAPETILACCKGAPEYLMSIADSLAEQGLRVLALARAQKKGEVFIEDLVFMGFVALGDPPRPEVKDAITRSKGAGIRCIMVTGDHKKTAVRIAQEVGLYSGGLVLEGQDIREVKPAMLHDLGEKIEVLARVNPEDKVEIIRLFKKLGHVVAMTGDGINDAPAIREADIGIAMGDRGTEVSREAADMVLSDDHFATIVAAVEEGRSIYDNIRKFIAYLLSCNIGEVIAVVSAVGLGMPIPFLPAQILWVNLITDGLPALALSMDPPQEDVMKRPPRSSRESLFSHGLGKIIACQGLVIGLITLLAYTYGLAHYSLDQARTVAFTTLVLAQLFYALVCSAGNRPLWQLKLFRIPVLLGAMAVSFCMQLLVLYWPPLQNIFYTVALPRETWFVIVPIALFPLLIGELRRGINRFLN